MNNISVTLAPYVYSLLEKTKTLPSNITVALQDSHSIDYDEMSYFLKIWIDDLEIRDHTYLGTSDGNLRVELLTPQYNFFIANVNTTPEYLFCYSANTTHITNTVWIKNFE